MAAGQGLDAIRQALAAQSIQVDLDAALLKAKAAGMREDAAWVAHHRKDAHNLLDSLMDAQLRATFTAAGR